jgi:hypothetical protein
MKTGESKWPLGRDKVERQDMEVSETSRVLMEWRLM